jgi:hypothetical protein
MGGKIHFAPRTTVIDPNDHTAGGACAALEGGRLFQR